MTIYLAMDDTDSLASRGTGKLARAVAHTLSEEYDVCGVTRHQLFVYDDIPFTSHNSCAVIHIEASGNDSKERILNKENLVIADEKKIIALAGVMGAKNTEVDESSKNVFLEAAIFSPLTVRRSRRAAGLDTESSYRFERRVFPDYLEYASCEVAKAIEKIARGTFIGYAQAGKKPPTQTKKITISLSHLEACLGSSLTKAKIKNIPKKI